MSTIILPGERVPASHVNLKLGPGLLQTTNPDSTSSNVGTPYIIATKAGELQQAANGKRWWVDNNSRRYVPALQESVVGVITQRLGESYRVDIGSAHHATLDALAFEGATKRSRPNLKVGSLIYARVSLAHKDMEPELECYDAQTRKAEGFGELKGGFVIRCSLKMCRNLMDPKHFLLPMLGSKFPVEIAIGMNGRAWINAKEPRHTIAVSRSIQAVDPDGGEMTQGDLKYFLTMLDA